MDPIESLVLFAADHGMDAEWLRTRRGWSEAEWSAASARLVERGLLGSTGLTEEGRAARDGVEQRTDALADAPWARSAHRRRTGWRDSSRRWSTRSSRARASCPSTRWPAPADPGALTDPDTATDPRRA